MKRYISTLALCALAFIGLNSCNKAQEVDLENGTRTVTFQVQMGPDTRTGLSVKFVPDWTDTKIANVHLFEDHKGNHMEGKNVKMEIDENNDEIAYFSADYTDEWTIIVDPTMPETRASATDYVYTGVVAQRTGEGDNAKYVVPDVQNPGKNTLIDPDADFLVGRAPEAYTSGQSLKQVDMIFKRPVSVSRLAIWGIPEGEKVQEVKIVSADKLTGSVALSGIDFENRTVEAFDETSGSTTITLNYGAGEAVPAEAFFNAYFISLPGAKKILSIEVTTDQKTYIKEFDGGKTLTFKTPDFKSIAVNMLDTATDDGKQERDLHFVKGQTTVTTDAYDIWDATNQTYAAAYVAPTLAGTTEGATPVWNSSDQDVATVDAEGNVTIVGAGTTEITVFIASSDTYKSGNASFTLTVSDSTPAPQDQPLKFVKGGATITEDNTDIYPEVSYTTPTLEGAVSGATVSFEISCTPVGCATIATDGTVTPVAAGVAVITAKATAVAPLWNETTKSYTLTITDSTPAPQATHHYEKVNAFSEVVENGKYIIVYEDGANTKVFKPVLSSDKSHFETTDNTENAVLMGGSWIASSDNLDACMVVLERPSSDGKQFDIYVPGVSTNETKYFFVPYYNPSGQSAVTFYAIAGDQGDYRPTFAVASGVLTLSRGTTRYFYLVSGAFNMQSSSPSNSKLALYKYVEGEDPAPVAQTLSFSPESYSVAVNASKVVPPTLSGAKTTVTYSITGNTGVATVDPESGALTLVAKGSTEVTATAAAENGYAEASKSYALTVTEAVQTSTYTKITSVDDLEEDGQYLIVFEGLAGDTDGDGEPKVFNPVLASDGNTFAKAQSSALDVTISSGAIESSDFEDCQFTLEDGYYLKANKAAKYIYPTGTNSYSMGAEASASHSLTISFDNGIAVIQNGTGTSARYLVWSISSHYFSCNTAVSNDNATGICLYKLEDGRQARSMEFSAATAEIDLANTSAFVKPALIVGGDATTVTYTSSNTAVAEVSNDGAITAKKTGKVTITAKAARTDTYKGASASYELTVTNSNTPKYVKADSMEADTEYLIYSNGFLLKNSSGLAKTAVEANDGVINYSPEASELWTASANGELTNNGSYLRLSTSFNSTSLSIGNKSSTASNNQWSYTAESDYLKCGSYFLYYTTSNSGSFTVSNTSASNHIATLYVLDDGQPKKRNLAFSTSAVSENIYGKTTPYVFTGAPTLSGRGLEDVTYSVSENTNIASVDPSTGAVTLGGETGTVTITASALATAKYEAGSTSYTLEVTSVAEKTYTKVTSSSQLSESGTYLIVGQETSAKDPDPAGLFVCVFPPESGLCSHVLLTNTTNASSVTTSNTTIFANEVKLVASDSKWLIKVGDQYLRYSSDGPVMTSEPTSDDAHAISPSTSAYTLQQGDSHKFYHSGSSHGFKYGTSSNVFLFKLSE